MEVDDNLVFEQEPEGLSNKIIKSPTESNSSFAPRLVFRGNAKMQAKFEGICLKQYRLFFTHKY